MFHRKSSNDVIIETREILNFAATRIERFGISKKTLNYWTGILDADVVTLVNSIRAQISISAFQSKTHVYVTCLAGDRIVSELGAQFYATFKVRLHSFLNNDSRKISEFRHFCDIFPLLTKTELSNAVETHHKKVLVRYLDFYGLHFYSEQISDDVKVNDAITWGAIRRGRVQHCSEDHGAVLHSQVEAAHEETTKRLITSNIPGMVENIGMTVIAFVLAALFVLISAIVAMVSRDEDWFRDQEDAAVNSEHWRLSALVLSNYWHDVGVAAGHAQQMLLLALTSKNLTIVGRSLDWYFYCRAHVSSDRLMLLGSSLILPTIQRHFPFLLPDLLLHRGIQNYYLGNIRGALLCHAEVERLLQEEHHPFNRAINLSTALRSTLVVKNPRLTTGLYRTLQNHPAFSRGILAKRSELCAVIQWTREDEDDGQFSLFLDEIKRLTQQMAPLPRGTLELLIAVDLLEANKISDGGEWLSRSQKSLTNGGLRYAYRRMTRALKAVVERRRLSRLRNLTNDITYLAVNSIRIYPTTFLNEGEWKRLSFSFGMSGIADTEEAHIFDATDILRQSETWDDLTQKSLNVVNRYLPEFRMSFSNGEELLTFHPRPIHQAFEGLSVNEGETKFQIVSRKGRESIFWTYVEARCRYKGHFFGVSLGAPSIENSEHTLRFLFANEIARTFMQMAMQIRLRTDFANQATNAAIAQTTQMLAHDVRKPFSLLRMGMSMLGGAKDPESVKQVLAKIVPEIDKAVRSVDGMIADVMEIGSPSTTLIQEAVSAESLIEATLGELIRMYPKSDISFAYDLKHVHMTNVHLQKVSRVFSNIVGNAFQAMRNKGSMWFKTVESNGMIQFCVGNSGTMIPEDSLKHLFDAFFTSGKKGGTGLGLAIAEKVVTAHGGRIWCESIKTAEHPEGKVEFFFTLPVATSRTNKSTNILPEHSGDVAKLLVMFTEVREPSLSVDKGELALEDDVLLFRRELGRPLRVLIIDDESIYRAALASYLTRTPSLEDALHLTLADGSQAALEAASKLDFDAIITDVDMGRSSLDGFELVRELRRRGENSLICVHSNRIVAADNKTAIDAGADSFLPKPMARAQFLRVLLQAAESTKVRSPLVEVVDAAESHQRSAHIKPGVLIVDDSEVVLLGWESELAPDCDFFCMKSFEDLQERLASDHAFLSHLSYVVTDMHLDGSYGDGLDVGRLIKSIRSDLPVLLSSDDTFLDSDLVGAVDKVIAKMPVDLPRLTQWRTKL